MMREFKSMGQREKFVLGCVLSWGLSPLVLGLSPLVFGIATPASAEEMELSTTLGTTNPDMRTTLDEVGVLTDEGIVELTLDQAITLALQRNLTLAVQRYQRSRSFLGIDRNRGIYDLRLNSTLFQDSDTRPPISSLEATDLLIQDTTVANVSLSQLVPFGGTARLDFFNNEVETSDQSANLNPAITVNVDLTYTQPLLRNFGRAVTERNLMVARRDAAISREDFQVQVENILTQVINGYWGLVEAQKQLAVAEGSLKLAQNLDRMNRIRVRVGTLAELEVIQSEAGVAARREGIIQFQTQVDNAADTLRSLTNLERTEAWDHAIKPVTDPETEMQRGVDFAQAVATAHEFRPEMKRQRLSNETLNLDAKVALNQKLPQVDLSARYGFNALDGDRPEGPGSYSNALDQIADRLFEGWRVTLQVGYPLQNRDAKARSAEAQLAMEQGDLELRNLELRIRTEVRSAARSLDAAVQRVETAKISSELAAKSLAAEEKRYQNGLSTSFSILQIQEDLSLAQTREVSSIINYRRAEATYYRAIGKLLEHHDVVLAEDQ